MSSPFSRMRSNAVFTFLITAAILFAAAPVLSVGEPPPPTSLSMTLLLEPHGVQEPLLLVAGELPVEQPLPAEIVLPVPDGARIEWAGDIVGGSVAEDIPAEAVIEIRDGVTVAVFTLTQSRVGQVEVTYPDAIVPVDDDVLSVAFETGMPFDADSIRMAVAVPPSLQVASLPEGVLTAQGPEGFVYYYTERGPLTSGDTVAFSLQYRPAPLAASGAGPGSAVSGEIPPLLIALIAVALAGALLFFFASRSRAREADRVSAAAGADEDRGFAEESRDDTALESQVDHTAHAAPEGSTPGGAAPEGLAGWLTPKRLIAITAVLILAIAILVNLGGEDGQIGVTEVSGGWISQRISDASAEGESEFALQILCDCPPEVEAAKMFDALRQLPGVAHASLEENTLTMRVKYDSAIVDEASIAERLRAAGYLE